MKNSYLFYFLLSLSIFMFGCSLGVPNSEPGIIGKVTDKKENSMLVVAIITNDSADDVTEYYRAIWFSNVPENVELGDEVKVWFDEVMESYPEQSEAKYVEVVPSVQHEGATLTESEALRKALNSIELKSLTAIRTIEYDIETKLWKIQMKNVMEDEEFVIEVEDK